jgi:Xylose isomerase-like TIM barrel
MSGNFEPQIAIVRDWSQPASPGQLDIMDLPDMLADRFGIHNVEVQQQNLLSMQPSYCRKFLERVQKAHSRVCDMSIELDPKGYSGTLSVCSADPQVRGHAIDLTKQWIDRAALLECPSIMPNQGTFPEDPAPAIEGLKAIRDYGESKGVVIILEPRGRSTVDTLAQVIHAAGIYANPDIGNFRDEETAERGLRLLYPLARTVGHVKISRRGLDFAKAIQISKEMNFLGVYSIETVTSDPYNEMQKVLDLLMENL